MAAQQRKAYYRIYNSTTQEWDYYFFKTTADQILTNNNLTIINSGTKVNGCSFTITNDGANAEATITGGDVNWYKGTKPSTTYLTSASTIQAAIVALDSAISSGPDMSDYLPLSAGSSNALTGALYFEQNGTTKLNIGIDYYGNPQIESNTGNLVLLSQASGQKGNVVVNADLVLEGANAEVTLKVPNGLNSNVNYNLPIKATGDTFAMLSDLGTAAAKAYTTSVTNGSNDLVTSGAVYTAIANLGTPMQYKGTVGSGGTYEWANLPSASGHSGWTFKAITTNDQMQVKVGDTIISDGTNWTIIPSGDEPSGTVTNVATGTGLAGGPITSSGTISLADNYGDTKNPYASKTKNYVLAAPSNANGTPSFRALVSSDIPNLSSQYLPRDVGTNREYPLFGTLNFCFVGSGNPQMYLDIGFNDDTSKPYIGSTWGSGDIELRPVYQNQGTPANINLYGSLNMMSDNGEESAKIHYNGGDSVTFTLPNKSNNDTFAMLSDVPTITVTSVGGSTPSSGMKAGDICIQVTA